MIMFWVAVLAISVLLYVLLDGFDLGVGILFGMTRDKEQRGAMLRAVSPVWDGNETWLVVTGVVLWGPFPLVYATLLSAFYLPLLLMLAGLILRGVTFEFRARAQGSRWVWDIAFAGGSLIATFIQGLTVGALVEGLPITEGHYSGGDFGWISPFALLCGVGLCLGYRLPKAEVYGTSEITRFRTNSSVPRIRSVAKGFSRKGFVCYPTGSSQVPWRSEAVRLDCIGDHNP